MNFKKIDVSKIFLKKMNRSFYNISYFGEKITFTTPLMSCAFGVEKEYSNYLMKLRFKNMNDEHSDLFDFISLLEDYIQKTLQLPIKSNIRKSSKFNPLLMVKLRRRNDKFMVVIEGDTLENVLDIEKNMTFQCVVQINNVWYNETKCSYKLTVNRIIFNSRV